MDKSNIISHSKRACLLIFIGLILFEFVLIMRLHKKRQGFNKISFYINKITEYNKNISKKKFYSENISLLEKFIMKYLDQTFNVQNIEEYKKQFLLLLEQFLQDHGENILLNYRFSELVNYDNMSICNARINFICETSTFVRMVADIEKKFDYIFIIECLLEHKTKNAIEGFLSLDFFFLHETISNTSPQQKRKRIIEPIEKIN